MSRIFSNKDTAHLGTQQEEPYNVLGESLTNLAWLQHLNVASIISPCGKYDDGEDYSKISSSDKISVIRLPSSLDYSIYARNKNKKPPYSYIILISLAFKNMKCDRLSVDQILDFLTKHFPYFESANVGDYIRNTLQHNKVFERVRKRKDEPYRGVFWRMSDNVIFKSDSDQEDVHGKDLISKKKRTSADNFYLDDPDSESRKFKKFRSRSTDFPANDKDFDFDYSAEDSSFFADYSWDSVINDDIPQRNEKSTDKYNDWFPVYEVDGKQLYSENLHLSNFAIPNSGFDDFDDSKIPYNFYGYGEVPGDLTSTIQFDPLLSASWSSNSQGEYENDMRGYKFNAEGV